MSDLPAPAAARLPRARWLDTRLLLGVLLVLVSVVLGAKVVAEADDTVPVWQVTRDLGAGSTLTRADLTRRDVALPGGGADYVAAGGDAPVGYVLVRPVGHDELLPRRALARDGEAGLRRLAIEVDRVVADGLEAGSVVDVYVVPDKSGAAGATAPAAEVLDEVTVADVSRDGGGLGGSLGGGGVTLLVTAPDAARILDAQARGTLALLEQDLSPTIAEAAGP